MLRTSRLNRPSGPRDHHSSATQPKFSAAITATLVPAQSAASCQTLSIAESSVSAINDQEAGDRITRVGNIALELPQVCPATIKMSE